MATLKNADFIFFDVRENRGGYSIWGEKILSNLFRKDFVHYMIQRYHLHTVVEWRASDDNIRFVNKEILHNKDHVCTKDPECRDSAKEIYHGMVNAKRLNHPLYKSKPLPLKVTPKPKYDSKTVSPKLIVITSGARVSACLDFVDMIKALNQPNLMIGLMITHLMSLVLFG